VDIHIKIKTNVKEDAVSWMRWAALAWGDENLQVVNGTIARRRENRLRGKLKKKKRESVKQTWFLMLNKEKN
jgi:hypothetical protein